MAAAFALDNLARMTPRDAAGTLVATALLVLDWLTYYLRAIGHGRLGTRHRLLLRLPNPDSPPSKMANTDLLERTWEGVGNFFGGLMHGFERGVTSVFGTSN